MIGFVLAACGPETKDPPPQRDATQLCADNCERVFTCRAEPLTPTEQECSEQCSAGKEWNGPCGEIMWDVLECTNELECDDWNHAHEQGRPCSEEKAVWSVCLSEKGAG